MLATQTDVAIRHDLLEQLANARNQSDQLFRIVKPGSLYERPIAERHRIIFYIGHLEAFDWNLLHERVLGLESFSPEFDRLFAFGIDPVGGGLPSDVPSDWPSADAIATSRSSCSWLFPTRGRKTWSRSCRKTSGRVWRHWTRRSTTPVGRRPDVSFSSTATTSAPAPGGRIGRSNTSSRN